ncbi:hypothetical protein CHS0354_023195 [Potamilus streckersoni]|uniref:Uncharacterized protein n=1 Tax=Potamilus streckersoni TaxID=2493646 RepID=A0AAE0SKC4_9BIVA|nr:hypothetical protein CHS0354_023195 [Potamilus streckersoni]
MTLFKRISNWELERPGETDIVRRIWTKEQPDQSVSRAKAGDLVERKNQEEEIKDLTVIQDVTSEASASLEKCNQIQTRSHKLPTNQNMKLFFLTLRGMPLYPPADAKMATTELVINEGEIQADAIGDGFADFGEIAKPRQATA